MSDTHFCMKCGRDPRGSLHTDKKRIRELEAEVRLHKYDDDELDRLREENGRWAEKAETLARWNDRLREENEELQDLVTWVWENLDHDQGTPDWDQWFVDARAALKETTS